MNRVSPQGLAALALHEGIVQYPYLDSVGVWTVGVGHTVSAGAPDPAALPRGEPLPMERVAAIFARDIAKFERRVNDAVKVPLAQHEFDALVSFDFNTGGIHRAKLTASLNAGDRAAAAQGFMGWLRPPEIRSRREAERDLFLTGVYPKGSIPIWRADDKGRLRGVAARMSQAEFVRLLGLLKSHAGTAI